MIRLEAPAIDTSPGYFNETVLEPLVLLATLFLGALCIVLPRRYAAIPFVVLACFLPVAQRVVIAGFDFTMIRLLIVFGVARVLLRGEWQRYQWNRIDTAFFAWVTIASVIWFLGHLDGDALVQRLGTAYSLVGLFVLFRCWLRDLRAIRATIAACALSAVAVAGFMAVEFTTGRNLFSIFGSVPEFTLIRHGRLRCQGTFPHPIMAGSAGAALAPLCLWLLLQGGRGRLLGLAGFLGSTAIVVFSASSGPLLGWAAGMGAWTLWLLRDYMPYIRWGVVAMVVALHVVMNRPVWHLIGHLNVIGGSTAFHRVRLIDSAIEDFPNWALLGTKSTAHWGWGMTDVTNQYILEGIRGGVASLIAIVVVLFVVFGAVGSALRQIRRWPPSRLRRGTLLLCWGVGTSVFVHAVNLFGVSYFGQIELFLLMAFAMAAGLQRSAHDFAPTPQRREKRSARVRALLGPRPSTA